MEPLGLGDHGHDHRGREFETRAFEMGAAVQESQSQSYELDAEGFNVVADRLVEESGMRAMLHRTFVAPIMDGDAVVGIITESKAGREGIHARRVIDASKGTRPPRRSVQLVISLRA